MSLYHKYRPNRLEDIVGNVDTVTTLDNMLTKPEHTPHAILFTGPSGCGKTTIGRIVANRLGVTGQDFIEVDSADFRGIDTIRDIRRNSSFKPINSKRRVWLIDECHKLTNDAQNALLKILEDTPQHAYFVLCTTEPQKLIKTIRSRCSVFELKLLNDREMRTLLRNIVLAEQETVTNIVYDTIITTAAGAPRTALQLLDQVLNTTTEQREAVAKKTNQQQAESIELCRALIKRTPWSAVRTLLTGLKDQEVENIRRHVLAYAQTVLLNGENDTAALVIEEFMEPMYNTGFAGLVYACYAVTKN